MTTQICIGLPAYQATALAYIKNHDDILTPVSE